MNAQEWVFVSALLVNPKDRTTLGVYHDWLIDQGRDKEAADLRAEEEPLMRVGEMEFELCSLISSITRSLPVDIRAKAAEVMQHVASRRIEKMTIGQRARLWHLAHRVRGDLIAKGVRMSTISRANHLRGMGLK